MILLSHLDATVAQLLSTYRELPSPDHVVPGEWSARDILAHLTFWHESFARNVGDLVAGRKPTPLKGTLAELNRRSVDELGDYMPAELVQRFAAAHELIRAGILDPGLTLIPYRRGSRDYSPEEHLQIVDSHIRQHLKEMRRRDGMPYHEDTKAQRITK